MPRQALQEQMGSHSKTPLRVHGCVYEANLAPKRSNTETLPSHAEASEGGSNDQPIFRSCVHSARSDGLFLVHFDRSFSIPGCEVRNVIRAVRARTKR